MLLTAAAELNQFAAWLRHSRIVRVEVNLAPTINVPNHNSMLESPAYKTTQGTPAAH